MSTTFKNIVNRFSTTIKAGSSINNSDDPVVFNITDATGIPSEPFYITIEQLTDNTVYERLLVTGVDGDELTATRAQDGSSKQTFSAGDLVQVRVIAAHIDEPTAAINNLEDIKDYADSPMIVTGGDITEGTNAGTFKVAALTALFRNTDSITGELVELSLAEQDNQAITAADTTYFIVLNYNDGVTPTISLSETIPYGPGAADYRNIPIGKVMKDGSDNVHFITGGFNFQDGVKKLHQRALELRNLELQSGSTIEYSGTNNFTMEAGVAYGGINRIVLDAYNSATTQFTAVYQDGGGGWTEALSNVIDYEHYDDGDGGLAEIANNKYGCFWVYKHADDGHVYVVYGRGSYTLAQAQNANEPTKPTHLTDFGLLIGCIIAPQAGGSFTDVQMVTDRFFTGTAVSDHGNLTGLGDDDHPQYIKDSEFTQDSGVLVGTGAGTFAEETGDTLRTSLGLAIGTDVAAAGANTDITSLQNAALYVGRDADNLLNWATDDHLKIKIGGVETDIVSISTGTGDNDKLVTQGYVDDAITGEDFWDRADTTISPNTANDNLDMGSGNILTTGDAGATASRITKGWFTDLEITNDPTINGTAMASIYAAVDQTMYIGTTEVAINRTSATLNLAGIGTLGCGAITSSSSDDSVFQKDGGAGVFSLTNYYTGVYAKAFDTKHARGSLASPSALTDNDEVGKWRFYGYTGAVDTWIIAAEIIGYVDGTVDDDPHKMPGRLEFYTTGTGADVNPTLALTLDSSQNATFAGTLGCGAITSTGDIRTVAWTDYSGTSTVTGWAATPTVKIYYKKVGNLVFCQFSISGTSNATSASFTLPYQNNFGATQYFTLARAYNNGADEATGQIIMTNGSTTVSCYRSTGANWTNSGNKNIGGEIWYYTTG